jgi:hydroxyethylthiazole kinase-like uncharacterized protein yjeF
VTAPADDPRRDYGALSAAEQSTLDAAAGGLGLGVGQLMELAGWQVARWLRGMVSGPGDRILVVAGRGNNGGDGLVAARHLTTWGHAVEVVLVADPERVGEPAAGQLRLAAALGVPLHASPDGAVPPDLLDRAALVVDALLGTGLRGDPRPPQAAAISRLPPERTCAVDVPSGLDATTGEPGRPTVRASGTCTLCAMKAGLWTPSGRAHAGAIAVADIGMPTAAWRAAGLVPPRLVRGGEVIAVPG